ncbi:toprim domain-containing protein [Janthinobacterium sp. JC611]|uniref:DUF7146 domain-containing protein n=1 Tax=Janthinobacterium sp. JC611 TaxID=2816201 RepID=UPI001BFCEF9A|nr:toprim domain-containing protein [Janthinobacterium sp. JC611]
MSRDKEEFNAHFQQVKQRAFGRWTEILLALGVDAKVLNQRNQPCPLGDCGGTDRFQYTDKFGHGNYVCRGCGAGGGFKLLMGCLGLSAVDALGKVDSYLGMSAPRPPISLAQDSRAERDGLIRKILAETVPVMPGDEVDRYLRNRGVNLERYPSTLRMHPALGYYERHLVTGKPVVVRRYPAMVACVQDKSGHTVSLHRTYLSNGEKARECAVKKLLCAGIDGAAIRLAPSTDELAVCEGIETALAVMKRSHQPVWAGVSAGNLEKLWIPETVKRLRIYADNDAHAFFDGQAAAYSLARRYLKSHARRTGRSAEVFVPKSAGADWAEVLLKISHRTCRAA